MKTVKISFVVVFVLVAAFFAWRACSTARSATGDGVGDPTKVTIYVLGGSTAYGEPYGPGVNLGTLVAYLFDGHVDQRELVVRNLAAGGIDAAKVLESAKQVEDDASVVFVYSGNNEFLQYDSIGALSEYRRTLFDQPTVSADRKAQVLAGYEDSLRELVRHFQARGVPVILSTVAVNLRDWEPNRSVLTDPKNVSPVKLLLTTGDELLLAEDVAGAIRKFEELVELEPGFALAHLRLGDAYTRSGRTEEARHHYQQAVNTDGNPSRATGGQNEFLRELARSTGTPLVDSAAILQELAGDQGVGFEVLWDNCHPTLGSYLAIAEGFAEELETVLSAPRKRRDTSLEAVASFFGIDPAFERNVLVGRGLYCIRSALLTWDPKRRLDRAGEYLAAAARIDPENVGLLQAQGIYHATKGERRASMKRWLEAYRRDPVSTEQRLAIGRVRELLGRIGIRDVNAFLAYLRQNR